MGQQPARDPQFPATRWSLVLSARREDSAEALGELCRLYWGPLYVFARRSGASPEDAEDLTQDFFRTLVEDRGRLLEGVDSTTWKLRTFLLVVFKRRIIDWRRQSTRLKRGGPAGGRIVPDFAETLMEQASPTRSPEEEFDRQWALSLLDSALKRLEQDCLAVGRSEDFQALRPFLGLGGDAGSYSALEEMLALSPAAARQAVSRFRQRFRQTLREEIASTLPVASPAAIDAEIAELQRSLR